MIITFTVKDKVNPTALDIPILPCTTYGVELTLAHKGPPACSQPVFPTPLPPPQSSPALLFSLGTTLTLAMKTSTFPQAEFLSITLQPLNQISCTQGKTLEHQLMNGHFKLNSQEFSIHIFIHTAVFVLYGLLVFIIFKKKKKGVMEDVSR